MKSSGLQGRFPGASTPAPTEVDVGALENLLLAFAAKNLKIGPSSTRNRKKAADQKATRPQHLWQGGGDTVGP